MPSRRIRRPAVVVGALVALLACDDASSGVQPIFPIDALEASMSIAPARIALGDTAWVTITLRNTFRATAVTTASSTGCPVVEPVVQRGDNGLRPFVPTCLMVVGREAIDPALTSLTVDPGESVQLRFPFTGTAIDVVGNSRCNVVGSYHVMVLVGAEESSGRTLVSGPGGKAVTATGEVTAPPGTSTCS